MNDKNIDYNSKNISQKDEIAKDFISQVNPYEINVPLYIYLRSLSKYANEHNKNIAEMDDSELSMF